MNGLQNFEDDNIHLVVPHGRRWPTLDELPARWHVSRHLSAEDRHPGSGVPRTRVDRSTIDAAAWSPRARSACGLLAAVVQQRLTTASRLLTTLESAGPIRHASLMRTVLLDIEGGAAALSEIDFGRLCKSHALPPPLRQVVRLDDHIARTRQ